MSKVHDIGRALPGEVKQVDQIYQNRWAMIFDEAQFVVGHIDVTAGFAILLDTLNWIGAIRVVVSYNKNPGSSAEVAVRRGFSLAAEVPG